MRMGCCCDRRLESLPHIIGHGGTMRHHKKREAHSMTVRRTLLASLRS